MDENIEKKVLSYEKKYGLLAKGFVDAVWVVDLASMQYLYVSPTVESIRGYTPEEIINTNIREHLTPDSYDTAVKLLVGALDLYKGGEEDTRTLELEFYRKDGTTIWCEVTARLYTEKDGSIRIIGVSKNIDERKKFEKEREALIGELGDAIAEKDRLLKENKILMGLLPICAECKMIRDEDGKWWQIEEYISSRTDAEFSHTICPNCKLKLYPQFFK